MSQHVKIRYSLSKIVKIRAKSRKKWLQVRRSRLHTFSHSAYKICNIYDLFPVLLGYLLEGIEESDCPLPCETFSTETKRTFLNKNQDFTAEYNINFDQNVEVKPEKLIFSCKEIPSEMKLALPHKLLRCIALTADIVANILNMAKALQKHST